MTNCIQDWDIEIASSNDLAMLGSKFKLIITTTLVESEMELFHEYGGHVYSRAENYPMGNPVAE